MSPENIKKQIDFHRSEAARLELLLIDTTRPDCLSGLRRYLERHPKLFVKHLVETDYPDEEVRFYGNNVMTGAFQFNTRVSGETRSISITLNEFEFDEKGFVVVDGRGRKIALCDYLEDNNQ